MFDCDALHLGASQETADSAADSEYSEALGVVQLQRGVRRSPMDFAPSSALRLFDQAQSHLASLTRERDLLKEC